MKTKKIAVLFGGRSPEYPVSLHSAAAVLQHMDRTRFEPVCIGIARSGAWYFYTGGAAEIENDTWCSEGKCVPAQLSLTPDAPGLLVPSAEGERKLPLDAAFPVLHGQNGEDGSVQGLCQLAGLPVVGCGVLASALCMDKQRAHALARQAGIETPRNVLVRRQTPLAEVQALAQALSWPLFVKPLRAGSSFGVSKVSQLQALPCALEAAFAYDSAALLEQAVEGFEVGCAVMGDRELFCGVPDEIELTDGFFNYTEKYGLLTSRIHVPARVPKEKLSEIQAAARRLYRALGCEGFARVDLFVRPDGVLVFNEINTIPGFTPHSRFPAMMAAAGRDFSSVVNGAITAALERAQ